MDLWTYEREQWNSGADEFHFGKLGRFTLELPQ